MSEKKEIHINHQANKQSFQPLIVGVSSGIASYIGDICTYPLDVINTKMKLSTIKGEKGLAPLLRIVKQEGFHGLWKGVGTQFYCTLFPQSIFFYTYENVNYQGMMLIKKSRLAEPYKEIQQTVLPLFSSTIAEIFCLACMLPFDIVRIRIQAGLIDYAGKSTLAGVRRVFLQEGLFRIYKATPIYTLSTFIFAVFQMQGYEFLRLSYFRYYIDESHFSLKASALCTVAATLFATFFANPLDLIVTRFQVINSSSLSISGLVKNMIKEEGIACLNRGLLIKSCYNGLGALFVFPVYEYFRSIYGIEIADL
jgi:Mitochondrial carrier protein